MTQALLKALHKAVAASSGLVSIDDIDLEEWGEEMLKQHGVKVIGNYVRKDDFSVDPVIDKCAFIDLNRIRTHLIVFHLGDFRPPSIVHRYSQKIIRLFNILDLNIAA